MMFSIFMRWQRAEWLCLIVALIILSPYISGPMALLAGALLASFNLTPRAFSLQKLTKKSLSIAIIGLGFGVPLEQALSYSVQGLPMILGSIAFVLCLGFMVGRALKLETNLTWLIAGGTAICGGSAIAAIAPTLRASNQHISVALATVFVLNAIALFVFPVLGHLFALSQQDFGLWAAIAIHDTSSVVGAASAYGDTALNVATTVKLSRALWIIPLTAVFALLFKDGSRKIAVPYFIICYVLAMLLCHALPQYATIYAYIYGAGKQLMSVALFFIGYSLTRENFQNTGLRPLILGITLWLAIALASLGVILIT